MSEMMLIENALKVNVTLVLKLEDFITGYPLSGGGGLKVISGDGFLSPVVKPNGYFVFTNRRPKSVLVCSDKYRDAEIFTEGHTGTVLRLSLIPRKLPGKTLELDGEAHIGFGAGYALAGAVKAGGTEIMPQKDDLIDITDLHCVLLKSDGNAEVIYLAKNLGGGRYAPAEAPKHAYPARGTRLIPLHRVIGDKAPVPAGATATYILSDGELKQDLEENP
jgi:hypothetical protein